MKLIEQINESFKNGLTKVLFDHIRNILIAAFLLAIGTNQLKEQSEMLFGFAPNQYTGIGVITVSFILLFINLYDGIRVICNTKWPLLTTIPLIVICLWLTIRILEMAWNFRMF